jgi:cellulose synthase/poly-beta-1,6-N-acetylglucosamine synthase-like glycosyltransferase
MKNEAIIKSYKKEFYNKNILKKHSIKGKNKEDNCNELGVSVITCTNRKKYIKNIFDNFNRQDYKKKELIIILNNNRLDKNKYDSLSNQYKNIRVFKIDEKVSLGECINFAVNKAKYEIIAKFDDDDYYAPKYLSDSLKAFYYTDADVIGKYTTYVYFEKDKLLAIRNPKRENKYVYRVEGSTLIFKKKIFNKIKFADKNLGEDVQFCKDCYKNGIKIYSLDRYNHVYIRHGSICKHTWSLSDEYYKKLCKIIGKVDDYKKYITKQ